MKLKINGKALAAAAATAAALAALSVPSAFAADASITLNAAQGQTLAGHTFTFYKLGDYADTVVADGVVQSYQLRGSDESNAWAQSAIDAFNASSDDDIEVPLGFDAAGAVASLSDEALKSRGVAKELADSDAKPVATATEQGSGSSITVSVPEGYYLVVDSAGTPMLLGTRIDGMDLSSGPLGVATIKSKAITVDKKIGADEDSLQDDGSYTVGSTVTQTVTTAVPNSMNGGAMAWKIVDDPQGLEYVAGSFAARLEDGTDVTGLFDVHETAGESVPGDASLVDATGARTDPDLTVPDHGFVADGAGLLAAHPNMQVTITYRALVTSASASNTATVSTVFADGVDTTPVEDEDTSASTAYAFDLLKTSHADPGVKVDGAGFKIQDVDLGSWLSYDRSTGRWSEAADQESATEFLSGDSDLSGVVDSLDDPDRQGMIAFSGLGAGTYLVEETTAPEGFSSYDIAMPSLTVMIGEDGQVTFAGRDLPALTTDNGDGTVTVANIANLTELPQTGGVWSAATWIVAALLAGGIGLGAVRAGRAIRGRNQE